MTRAFFSHLICSFNLFIFSPVVWSISKHSAAACWNRRRIICAKATRVGSQWPCLGVEGGRGASSQWRICTGSTRSLNPRQGQGASRGAGGSLKAVGRGRREKRAPWPLRFWRRRKDWWSDGDLSFTWGSAASASMTASQRDKPCCTGECRVVCTAYCALRKE